MKMHLVSVFVRGQRYSAFVRFQGPPRRDSALLERIARQPLTNLTTSD